MGVYFPNMEMPNNHSYVTIIIWSNGDASYGLHDRGESLVDFRSVEAVPVPPHGRLGDLDRMLADNEIYYNQLGRPSGVIRKSYMAVKHSIEFASTVIPADGKDTNAPTREEGRVMNREEKLEKMGELADHIIGALRSGTFIPMSYVRSYNDLVQAVFGDEDPEMKEETK